MKIIVTGGSGFIGGHLVERLIADGHLVICLDVAQPRHLKNVTQKIRTQIVNLTSIDGVENKLFAGVDWVFHLAGASDIIPSIGRPLDYHKVNVTATINVLEACRKAGVKRFLYAASSTCYGIADKFPTPEIAEIRPQYPYSITKYLGELYALHYAQVYKLPVISLRLFNVYGPRSRASMEYGPVFSTFMAQKLAGAPFTVVGDGRQSRDFTFVTDVVDAMITAVKSKITGDVFNVGSGGTYSVNRLVKLLGGKVVYIPKRPGEPDCTWADISKIKKSLGWSPKISFEKGVGIVLEHISDWKDAPVWTPASIKKATKEWFDYLS